MLFFFSLQIYILLYKEVALALKINSVYSKKKLLSIHENVRVLRYPDHFSTGVYLWYEITQNFICLWFYECVHVLLEYEKYLIIFRLCLGVILNILRVIS